MVSLQALLIAAALSGAGETVLLDFSADWCVPCREMQPTIRRLEQNGFPVRQINVDHSPDLARQFGVRPIPCFVLVVNGREVDRVVGAASYDRLVQMFSQAGVRPGQNRDQTFRGQSPDRPIPPPADLRESRLQEPPAGPRRESPLVPMHRPDAGLQTLPSLPQPNSAMASQPSHRSSVSPQELALQATVRLEVIDSGGQSYGTGTIIHTHGDEALVLTCGHLFRESKGAGQILVNLFAPGASRPVPGTLLVYEAEQRDVALVSIRPGIPVTPVPVAATQYRPQPGDVVFTIGCDHGEQPSIQESAITAVDRYLGPPNLEVRGHPVEGRSGGGLFAGSGQLIGICNAADLQEDRGIYAALATICMELKRINLASICGGESPVAATNAGGRAGAENIAAPAVRPLPLAERNPPLVPASLTPRSAAPAGDMELICILRSRANPHGESKVIVIDRPSSLFIQQLVTESESGPGSREAPRVAVRPQATSSGGTPPIGRPAGPPIVRAQNDH